MRRVDRVRKKVDKNRRRSKEKVVHERATRFRQL